VISKAIRPAVLGAIVLLAIVGLANVTFSAPAGADGEFSVRVPMLAADSVPGEAIATFRVGEFETYRIRLTEPDDIWIAHRWLAGELEPTPIPNGLVVRGETDVNEGYSWHIDPNDIEFADFTIELCDGLPSDVEAGTITSDRFCPWSAEIESIEEAVGQTGQ
jgi:hypothetical protein